MHNFSFSNEKTVSKLKLNSTFEWLFFFFVTVHNEKTDIKLKVLNLWQSFLNIFSSTLNYSNKYL